MKLGRCAHGSTQYTCPVPKVSAGLLMCRMRPRGMEFLLAHPGGPYFARRDEGVWTIPKGMLAEGEPPFDAACREFQEETGLPLPNVHFEPLGEIRQRGGKIVHAWAFLGDCDPTTIRSNEYVVQWPPRSGEYRRFPEVDRASFFDAETARRKLIRAQSEFIERALSRLMPDATAPKLVP